MNQAQAIIPANPNPDPALIDPSELPAPINVFALGNIPDLSGYISELGEIFSRVDLIFCLGNVDLATLASTKPAELPALVVLAGSDDPAAVPTGFHHLDGNGFSFRDWKIGGLSGSSAALGGNYKILDEASASARLIPLHGADILLSHMFPQGLRDSEVANEVGLNAIDEYLFASRTPYLFYANPGDSFVEVFGNDDTPVTVSYGVNGYLEFPGVEFII